MSAGTGEGSCDHGSGEESQRDEGGKSSRGGRLTIYLAPGRKALGESSHLIFIRSLGGRGAEVLLTPICQMGTLKAEVSGVPESFHGRVAELTFAWSLTPSFISARGSLTPGWHWHAVWEPFQGVCFIYFE